MQEIIVSSNEAGQRLDKMLAKYLNEAPKSFLYKMLRKKNIVLNGKKASGQEKLSVGDSVKMFLSDETIAKFSSTNVIRTHTALDIIYEDENILLINKPVGMLSQKASADDESLVEHIISYMLDSKQLTEEDLRKFRPSVCNRLDRNTSGLVAAGKSLAGLQEMGALFKNRSLRKYYRCLVAGEVKERQSVSGYLVKDERTNKVSVSKTEKNGSLPIETKYKPIWTNGTCTLLEVHLITGRTHQIRAHLASIGSPIIGDYKYGEKKVNEQFKRQYGLKSQLLHAYRLEMPICKGAISNLSEKEFIAPLPKFFQKILKSENYNGE